MSIYLSLAVALAGALTYAFAGKVELKEIGRLSFACGLLSFLLTFRTTLHLP